MANGYETMSGPGPGLRMFVRGYERGQDRRSELDRIMEERRARRQGYEWEKYMAERKAEVEKELRAIEHANNLARMEKTHTHEESMFEKETGRLEELAGRKEKHEVTLSEAERRHREKMFGLSAADARAVAKMEHDFGLARGDRAHAQALRLAFIEKASRAELLEMEYDNRARLKRLDQRQEDKNLTRAEAHAIDMEKRVLQREQQLIKDRKSAQVDIIGAQEKVDVRAFGREAARRASEMSLEQEHEVRMKGIPQELPYSQDILNLEQAERLRRDDPMLDHIVKFFDTFSDVDPNTRAMGSLYMQELMRKGNPMLFPGGIPGISLGKPKKSLGRRIIESIIGSEPFEEGAGTEGSGTMTSDMGLGAQAAVPPGTTRPAPARPPGKKTVIDVVTDENSTVKEMTEIPGVPTGYLQSPAIMKGYTKYKQRAEKIRRNFKSGAIDKDETRREIGMLLVEITGDVMREDPFIAKQIKQGKLQLFGQIYQFNYGD